MALLLAPPLLRLAPASLDPRTRTSWGSQSGASSRALLTRASRALSNRSPLADVTSVSRRQHSSGRRPVRAGSAETPGKSDATTQEDGIVLVVGATGGVGQLVVASLLEKGQKVRALVRNTEKAKQIFSGAPSGLLETASVDLRFPEQLTEDLTRGITQVVLCTGTTAFPSKRWDGNNGPEQTDYVSVNNLLSVLPHSLSRLVMVSSVGVLRYNTLPFNILNLFGVLKYKRMAEELVEASGIPYTIIRPGRLTDGPYTSYDLNTLLKATSGLRKDVVVRQGDSLNGEASRIMVAEAAAQALSLPCALNKAFEIISVEGTGPGQDRRAWERLFSEAPVA